LLPRRVDAGGVRVGVGDVVVVAEGEVIFDGGGGGVVVVAVIGGRGGGGIGDCGGEEEGGGEELLLEELSAGFGDDGWDRIWRQCVHIIRLNLAIMEVGIIFIASAVVLFGIQSDKN